MFLRELYERQREKNPRISRRGFARRLGISPAHLSEILSGKKRLSLKTGEGVSKRLSLSETDREQLFAEIVESLRQAEITASPPTPPASFHTITTREFVEMSTWYHSALQELVELPNFESSPEWIARRLGISVAQARSAVTDLIRTKVFKRAGAKLVKTHRHLRIAGKVGRASRALRELHISFVKRAIVAIRSAKNESRAFGGVTMAIDPAKIPEANERMVRFRRELMTFLESGERTEVYHLSMQLFRLDSDGRNDEAV